MASQWFYKVMGKQFGPVSSAALRNLAQRGTISTDTPIANAPSGPWVPAARVKPVGELIWFVDRAAAGAK